MVDAERNKNRNKEERPEILINYWNKTVNVFQSIWDCIVNYFFSFWRTIGDIVDYTNKDNPSTFCGWLQVPLQFILLGGLIAVSLTIPGEIDSLNGFLSSVGGKAGVITAYAIGNLLPSIAILLQYKNKNSKFGKMIVEILRLFYFILIIAGSVVVALNAEKAKTGGVLTITGIVQDRALEKTAVVLKKRSKKEKAKQERANYGRTTQPSKAEETNAGAGVGSSASNLHRIELEEWRTPFQEDGNVIQRNLNLFRKEFSLYWENPTRSA